MDRTVSANRAPHSRARLRLADGMEVFGFDSRMTIF
jgi:hypothetical protein